MLERISKFYGKEAAANDKPRNADADKDFISWADNILVQMDDEYEDFDYYDNLDHMIDCWENGYDDYKRGDII